VPAQVRFIQKQKVSTFWQATFSVQVLQCAQASVRRGALTIKFLYLAPYCCHSVAHPTTHRPKPCEIYCIRQTVRAEDVRQDEVQGQAREGFRWVGLGRGVRGRHAPFSTLRATFLPEHR
jgi:hypothetical protein